MNPDRAAIENIESSIQECTAGVKLFDNSINIRAEVSALARMGPVRSKPRSVQVGDSRPPPLHHSANRLVSLSGRLMRLKARMKSGVETQARG